MNGMPKRQIIASAKDFRFREMSIGLNVQFFICIEDAMRPTECPMGCNPTNFLPKATFRFLPFGPVKEIRKHNPNHPEWNIQ